MLEKKKDYVLRAKDFHKKQKTIENLRRKAEERNPDEFYFAMERARTRDGVHVVPSSEPNKYSQEQLRLMKSQDVNYLAVKAQAESKKVERLQSSLHMIGAFSSAPKRQHVIFVDDAEQALKFDPAKYFDTPDELLDRSYNRLTRSQLDDPGLIATAAGSGEVDMATIKKSEKRRDAAYRELLERQKRQSSLMEASHKMEYDRAVMGNGRKRKLKPEEIVGGAKKVFKWKAERKR